MADGDEGWPEWTNEDEQEDAAWAVVETFGGPEDGTWLRVPLPLRKIVHYENYRYLLQMIDDRYRYVPMGPTPLEDRK